MIRPRNPKDPRSEIVGVRLTPAEKQEIEAKAAGIPLSRFLRAAALCRSLPLPIPSINLQSYQVLLNLNLTVEQIRQVLIGAAGDWPQNEQIIQAQTSLLQDIKAELKPISQAVLALTARDQADEDFCEDEYNL